MESLLQRYHLSIRHGHPEGHGTDSPHTVRFGHRLIQQSGDDSAMSKARCTLVLFRYFNIAFGQTFSGVVLESQAQTLLVCFTTSEASIGGFQAGYESPNATGPFGIA